jgi:hypothetical protein
MCDTLQLKNALENKIYLLCKFILLGLLKLFSLNGQVALFEVHRNDHSLVNY